MIGISSSKIKRDFFNDFSLRGENKKLRLYIEDKLNKSQKFILPRIAGIENQIALWGVTMDKKIEDPISDEEYNKRLSLLKLHSGIKCSSKKSIILYSQIYLDAFQKSDCYFWWEPWGNVVKSIVQSYRFVILNLQKHQKLIHK